MSESVSALRNFEAVTESFYEKFKLPVAEVVDMLTEGSAVSEASTEAVRTFAEDRGAQMAVKESLDLSYNMVQLDLTMRPLSQQIHDFAHYGVGGTNPDIRVNTYDPKARLAAYEYDRTAGLIVVNNFGFEPTEVQHATDEEVSDLRFSISPTHLDLGSGIARVLTPGGIVRLTQDIATAFSTGEHGASSIPKLS